MHVFSDNSPQCFKGLFDPDPLLITPHLGFRFKQEIHFILLPFVLEQFPLEQMKFSCLLVSLPWYSSRHKSKQTTQLSSPKEEENGFTALEHRLVELAVGTGKNKVC